MTDSGKYHIYIKENGEYAFIDEKRSEYEENSSEDDQIEPDYIERLREKLNNQEDKISVWRCLQVPDEEEDDDNYYEVSDSRCYLTSACMRFFREKFDDNCYELTVLRWFRDNYVSKEDISHYYRVAPIIVERINKEKNSNLIYDYIYDSVVYYCVTEIEKGNYEEAYKRYKDSVVALETYYNMQSDKKTISKKTRKLVNSYV